MIRALAIAVLLFAAPAIADPSPSQTAIQIDNVVNQWAQMIEALQRENADLKKQIEDLKAQQEKK